MKLRIKRNNLLVKKSINDCLFYKILLVYFFCFFTITINNSLSFENNIPSLERTYNNWNVFSIVQNEGKICYLVASPIKSIGNYEEERKPYIMVSLFGFNKLEISINAGFFYKLNSIVYVSIDGQQERFIAETDNLAYTEKIGRDKQISNLLMKGKILLVFYQAYDGTYAVDTYSLSGYTKAYFIAKELCKTN